ncbi:hypothetical protein [Hymenobacter pini]|uniref:hypothetical protein n=1 Tax=Hymenobacter pini TaxID=2880879 RepID=UPI001CF47EFD|nr:hypothetical protein [Hymenobacter pini]MCA8832857.1 hypothetical protein [Hymenobacter pini]
MSSFIPAFVEQLTALRYSRTTPEQLRTPDTQALFTALFNNQLKAQVGPEVAEQASQLVAHYYKAVQLCRKNELTAALAQLHLTDARQAGLPAPAVEFVTLFQLSAWGNYYYKNGEGTRGIDTLLHGLSISARLEQEGYEVFIHRRIEQLHNIATIYLKQQQYEQAHALIKNTLTFVHSGQASGLFIADWDGALLGRVKLFQEATLEDSLGRMAGHNTQLMDHPTYGNEFYYQHYLRDLLRDLATTTYNRLVLHNWLYAKASYFEQGPEAFFRNVLEFLSDPDITPNYDVFRANLLAQAIWAIRQQPVPQQAELIATIQQFSDAHLLDRMGKVIKLAA